MSKKNVINCNTSPSSMELLITIVKQIKSTVREVDVELNNKLLSHPRLLILFEPY